MWIKCYWKLAGQSSRGDRDNILFDRIIKRNNGRTCHTTRLLLWKACHKYVCYAYTRSGPGHIWEFGSQHTNFTIANQNTQSANCPLASACPAHWRPSNCRCTMQIRASSHFGASCAVDHLCRSLCSCVWLPFMSFVVWRTKSLILRNQRNMHRMYASGHISWAHVTIPECTAENQNSLSSIQAFGSRPPVIVIVNGMKNIVVYSYVPEDLLFDIHNTLFVVWAAISTCVYILICVCVCCTTNSVIKCTYKGFLSAHSHTRAQKYIPRILYVYMQYACI